MNKKPVAMIFGATGQDSSYLAELLLEKDYKVIGVKRRSSTNTTERLNSVIDNENFFLIEGDIVDPSSVNCLIGKYQPDECYNLAAMSHVHTSFEQPFYTFQVNAVGVLNILEGVRNYSPKTKILQASTSELFGSNYDVDKNGNKYQDENTQFSPNSPYAVSKLAAHELVRLYRDSYGIFVCSSICFNHESKRRGENFVTRKITKWLGDLYQLQKYDPQYSVAHKGIINAFCFASSAGCIDYGSINTLKLGNLDAVRDWSHAKDMVEGMWMMLQQDKPKDYVLCSGVGHSVRDFLDEAFNCVGIDDWSNFIEIDLSLYRLCEVEFLQGKYDLAKKELGWQPKISFKELVRGMVQSDIDKVNLKAANG